MSRYESERAILIRRAAGVRGLQDPHSVAWRIAESLGNAVEITTVPDGKAECVVRRDGGARIRLPQVANELVEALFLLEELGHYLCHGPYPDPPAVHPFRATLRELRAAQVWERILESEVARFVLEAVLPGEELRRLRNEADWIDALEATGLEARKLEDRFLAVWRNPVPFPPGPPSWCSWHFYRVDWFSGPISGRFLVSAPDADAHTFEIVCRPQDRGGVEKQIFRDLAALTPVEFGLKYGAERSPEGERCFAAWGEL